MKLLCHRIPELQYNRCIGKSSNTPIGWLMLYYGSTQEALPVDYITGNVCYSRRQDQEKENQRHQCQHDDGSQLPFILGLEKFG
jgi:hypothetical protein